MVLEGWETQEDSVATDGGARDRERVLLLSGKSEQAVRDLAGRYGSWLEGLGGLEGLGEAVPDELLADAAWTAAVGRSHFGYRSALPFLGAEDLATALSELERGAAKVSRSLSAEPRVAFLFTGQGSQWTGMGKRLYETEPVFRDVLDRCEETFREMRGASLLDVMFGRAGAQGDLDDTTWTQPALYALGCALSELFGSMGVAPVAVLGHSVGELAAAHVAGAYSLEDGMRLTTRRGELMGSLVEPGAMAAVFASAEKVREALDRFDDVELAADNLTHRVVSGPADAVTAFSSELIGAGVRVKALRTSCAFHSRLMDPILDDLEALGEGLDAKPPLIPLVGNVSGRALRQSETIDGAYVRAHARRTVEFAKGAEALAKLGADVLVEIGPHPVLAPLARMAWPEGVEPPPVVPSLHRDEDAGFAGAFAAAYEAGLELDHRAPFAGEDRRRASVPSYPFQRERYWVDGPSRTGRAAGHELLGVRTDLASGETVFENVIDPFDPEWLDDHRVYERVVAPGAIYGSLGAAAAEQLGHGASEQTVQLHSPMVFEPPSPGTKPKGRAVQTIVGPPDAGGERALRIHSRAEDSGDWVLHAEGALAPGAAGSLCGSGQRVDDATLVRGLRETAPSGLYAMVAAVGLVLGPSFRTIRRLWSEAGESVAQVTLPEGIGTAGLGVHPALLDGCFQCCAELVPDTEEKLYTPFAWERFRMDGPLPRSVTCRARLRENSSDDEADGGRETITVDLTLYDDAGFVVGEVAGFSLKSAPRAALFAGLAGAEGVDGLLHRVEWRQRALAEVDADADAGAGVWVVAGGGGVVDEVAGALAEGGRRVLVAGEGVETTDYDLAAVDPARRDSWRELFARFAEGGESLTGVVHVSVPEEAGTEDSAKEVLGRAVNASARALALIQGLEDANVAPAAGCWLVTWDAQLLDAASATDAPGPPTPATRAPATPAPDAPDAPAPDVRDAPAPDVRDAPPPIGAALWGFGHTVIQEAPHLRCRLVDIDDDGASRLVDELLSAMLSGEYEPAVALRGRDRYVARLAFGAGEPGADRPVSGAAAEPPADPPEVQITPGASYLITGGLGALGLEVAEWLVERGAGGVVGGPQCAPRCRLAPHCRDDRERCTSPRGECRRYGRRGCAVATGAHCRRHAPAQRSVPLRRRSGRCLADQPGRSQP